MFNSIIKVTVFLFTAVAILAACNEKVTPKPVQTDFSFTEEFDTVANLYKKGWVALNNSSPIGETTWSQGVYENGKFGIAGWPAFSYNYAATDYLYVESSCGYGSSYISNWMITPVIMMKDSDIVSFYTRTSDDPSAKADRLQVRANYTSTSAEIARTPTAVGDFSRLIIDINSTYCKTCSSTYPTKWVKLEFKVKNGSSVPVPGRFAFRYFVEGGGPDGIRSEAIGIDAFKFTSAK